MVLLCRLPPEEPPDDEPDDELPDDDELELLEDELLEEELLEDELPAVLTRMPLSVPLSTEVLTSMVRLPSVTEVEMPDSVYATSWPTSENKSTLDRTSRFSTLTLKIRLSAAC